ncbi:MAG: hydroxymethylbilane synthase [Candidatus Omnitrophota bacterium]
MAHLKRITIGARGSKLSLAQAAEVVSFLKKEFPRHSFSCKKIITKGDRLKKTWPLDSQGIFVKEIETALLKREIDLAVHSMKDLPTAIPPCLRLVSVTKREDCRDVLVSKNKAGFFSLRKRAVVGTSSLRRAAQLLHRRPDLRIKHLRGNLDTRIRKLKQGEFDAVVVAAAGILRLKRAGKEIENLLSGLNLYFFPPAVLLPAVGQGALGVQIRRNDRLAGDVAIRINDRESYVCVAAERAFLKETGGGCRVPVAALARTKEKKIVLEAAVFSLDGRRMVRSTKEAGLSEAESLGKKLAREILKSGGREILKETRQDGQG